MSKVIFIKDMDIYQHGNNEPFKVDIVAGTEYEVEDTKSKLLVFAYCDWMSGTLAMDIESIIEKGYAIFEK